MTRRTPQKTHLRHTKNARMREKKVDSLWTIWAHMFASFHMVQLAALQSPSLAAEKSHWARNGNCELEIEWVRICKYRFDSSSKGAILPLKQTKKNEWGQFSTPLFKTTIENPLSCLYRLKIANVSAVKNVTFFISLFMFFFFFFSITLRLVWLCLSTFNLVVIKKSKVYNGKFDLHPTIINFNLNKIHCNNFCNFRFGFTNYRSVCSI